MPLTTPQKAVADSKSRFNVLVTGRRFGKTHLAVRQLIKFASKPKQKIWYVAPTYKQAKMIAWEALKEKLEQLRWIKKINESYLTMVLKNGSSISLKGADRGADNLRGVGLNYLVIDEFADIDPSAWYAVLRATLSDTKGHAFFCGTPKGYGNWAYDLYSKGQKGDRDWNSFQYTTLQGEQVDQDEIDQARLDLDERTFRQEYMASFETYAGAIYYNFDVKGNVQPWTPKPELAIHIGMDFNIDPMTACCFQMDGDNIRFFDEIVIYGSNTDEMVEEIRIRYGRRKIYIYPDPSCRARKTSAGGRSDLTILQNAGFDVRCKNKAPEVRDRINAVNSKLKNANNDRLLFLAPKCKKTILGLERHLYKEGTSVPDKENGYDHMNDAVGYAVDYLFPIRKIQKHTEPMRWS